MKTLCVREYIRDLVEATFPLNQSKRQLRDLQMTISEHLFKVFFLRKDHEVTQWRNDLTGWSVTLGRLNKDAKSDSQLLKALWQEPFGTDEDLRTLARLFGVDEATVLAGKLEFKAFVDHYISAIFNGHRWLRQC